VRSHVIYQRSRPIHSRKEKKMQCNAILNWIDNYLSHGVCQILVEMLSSDRPTTLGFRQSQCLTLFRVSHHVDPIMAG
jgi:hypothetical protein